MIDEISFQRERELAAAWAKAEARADAAEAKLADVRALAESCEAIGYRRCQICIAPEELFAILESK